MKRTKGLYPALIERLGLMVKENVALEQRVHQLMDDYNRVARQLRDQPVEFHFDKEISRENFDKISTSDEMKNLCKRLQFERDQAYISMSEFKQNEAGLLNIIKRYEKSVIMQSGDICPYNIVQPDDGDCVKIGSAVCHHCSHFMTEKSFLDRFFTLCSYRYDKLLEEETNKRQAKDE